MIDFSKLIPYAPHRPPMVWIDQVLRASATDGECLIQVKKNAMYMERGALRPSACIEFIAQAYGYMSIAYRLGINDPNAKPLKRAFLAAIKDAQLPSANNARLVLPGDELTVRISGIRHLGPIASFQGQVIHKNQLMASGGMKVYFES